MRQIRFKQGNLYLESGLCDTYFPGISSVVLLKKDDCFLMLPVQQAGGGLLLKIINSNGDRVVNTAEFFQQNDIAIDKEQSLDVEWSSEMSALMFELS